MMCAMFTRLRFHIGSAFNFASSSSISLSLPATFCSKLRCCPYLLSIYILTFLTFTFCSAEESINAYIPSKHKVLFDQFNAVVFGDASIAKAAFRGSLAIAGKAEIAHFDIGADKICDHDKRSLLVGGTLKARSGTINNGYTVLGPKSQLHHSVQMPCSNRVERYDIVRNGDLNFEEQRRDLLSEAAKLCSVKPNANITTENSTMVFHPGEPKFNCYAQFRVSAKELRLIDTWKYGGDDFYRNSIIIVTGIKSEFKEFRMIGFNPKRTLIVFCAMFGSITIQDAKFHGSIFAPTTSFTTMNAIINGSIIIGNLRGSIATLNVPYVTC